MKYTIYLRTNKINGKQYVGQTNNLTRRNNQFNSLKCSYNKLLDEDRIKYGVENFDTKILSVVDTREEAWELEKKFIKELNTVYPRGYNKAYGGKTNKGGNIGYHNGKEFEKGHTPWNKGYTNCFSEDTIKKMSEKRKGKHNSPSTEFKKGMTSWMKGRKMSEEHKEKDRLTHLGKIYLTRRKPIIQLTLNFEYIKEFSRCEEAAKELGFKSDESIRKACKEHWRTSGGFKWMYKEDYEKMLENEFES